MKPVERNMRIGAPLEFVWRAFTEIDSLPERMRHVVEVARISGPKFGVGTRWRHVSQPQQAGVGPVASEIEVIGCRDGDFFVLEMNTPFGRSVNGYEFRAVNPVQTELRALVQMQPSGLASRISLGLFGKQLARVTEQALDRLLQEFSRAAERLHQQSLH